MTTPRNEIAPDAINAAELLEILRRPPARNVLRDEIAVVIDFEDRGVRAVEFVHYDEENRLLVLEMG